MSKARVGNLSVVLSAFTDPFNKAMRGAEKYLNRFERSLNSGAATFAKWGSIATAAAVAGVGVLTKQTFASIDATAKMADQIGTSTEALIGMRNAADEVGVSSETMDSALAMMSKRLGGGSDQVAGGLEDIGLSLSDMLGLDPAEQFRKIADGVSKLETQEKKAAAVTDIFGKSGAELINVLDQGRAGIDAATQETVDLGTAFSRVDAAKVEEAVRAMHDLDDAFTGVKQRLAIELSGVVTAAAEELLSFGDDGATSADKISNAFMGVITVMARLMDIVNLGIAGFYKLGQAALKVRANFKQSQVDLGEMIQNTLNFFGAGIEDTSAFDDLKDEIKDMDALAASAGATAARKFGDALDGTISQSIVKWFEKMRAEQTARAERKVKEKTTKRDDGLAAAAADAERGLRAEQDAGMRELLDMVNAPAGEMSLKDIYRNAGAPINTPVSTTARGTFSGANAGRAFGGGVQEKQLETLNKMDGRLEQINDNLKGGVPLG